MAHVETLQNTKNILVWFVLACSILLGGVALVVAIRPVPIPPTPAIAPVGVGGIAELAVINHLVRAVGDGKARIPVAHTIGVDPAGPEQWAARVAVHDPNALRLWQVSVTTAQGTPQVLGMPAMIPMPDLTPVSDGIDVANGNGDSEITKTVTDTLTGLLTGSPDISRYTSSDSTLKSIDPPPFVGVQVIQISKPMVMGEDHLVLASVKAQRSDGVVIGAQYPLALIHRDGRWEVRGILRALPGPTPSTNPTHEGS